MNSSNENISAKRLIDLLDYVEKLERLSRKPFFQVSNHKSFSVYEHKLYGLPGINLDLQIDDEPVWLKVDRLNPKKPPELPENLSPFVLIKDDPNQTPVLINRFEQILITTVSLLDAAGQYWSNQAGQTGRTLSSATNRLTITDT